MCNQKNINDNDKQNNPKKKERERNKSTPIMGEQEKPVDTFKHTLRHQEQRTSLPEDQHEVSQSRHVFCRDRVKQEKVHSSNEGSERE